MTFKKYPDIERLGHDDNREILMFGEDMLFIEEKVDGGNGSFWLEEDGTHFGSRSRDLTLENDTKMFQGFQLQLRLHLAKLEKEGIKINQNISIILSGWQSTRLHIQKHHLLLDLILD